MSLVEERLCLGDRGDIRLRVIDALVENVHPPRGCDLRREFIVQHVGFAADASQFLWNHISLRCAYCSVLPFEYMRATAGVDTGQGVGGVVSASGRLIEGPRSPCVEDDSLRSLCGSVDDWLIASGVVACS